MFRNDKQLGDVCFILCAWIPSSPWKWDRDGYRRTFFEVPPGVSSGERQMILFAAALWGGDDLPVWRGYDRKRFRDIGELILAMNEGDAAIDAWIAKRVAVSKEGRVWKRPDDGPWLDSVRVAWEADVRSRARS